MKHTLLFVSCITFSFSFSMEQGSGEGAAPLQNQVNLIRLNQATLDELKPHFGTLQKMLDDRDEEGDLETDDPVEIDENDVAAMKALVSFGASDQTMKSFEKCLKEQTLSVAFDLLNKANYWNFSKKFLIANHVGLYMVDKIIWDPAVRFQEVVEQAEAQLPPEMQQQIGRMLCSSSRVLAEQKPHCIPFEGIHNIALSGDGKLCVGSNEDNGHNVVWYDGTTGEQIFYTGGDFFVAKKIYISPSTVVGIFDEDIECWDRATRTQLHKHLCHTPLEGYKRTQVSSTGQWVIYWKGERGRLWHPKSGMFKNICNGYPVNQDPIFSSNDKYLAFFRDKILIVRELKAKKEWTVEGALAFGGFSGDEQRCVVIDKNNEPSVYESRTAELIKHIESNKNEWEIRGALGAQLNADGTLLATQDEDKICLWGVARGTRLHILDKKFSSLPGYSPLYFSPDGLQLIANNKGKNDLTIWSIATGKELDYIPHSIHTGCNPIFSPDGRLMAVYDWHNKIRVYDLVRNKIAYEFTTSEWIEKAIKKLAFSPDGIYLKAASCAENKATLTSWIIGGNNVRKFKQNYTLAHALFFHLTKGALAYYDMLGAKKGYYPWASQIAATIPKSLQQYLSIPAELTGEGTSSKEGTSSGS